jgi:uncharacterized protein (TIGR02466 family)
MIHNLFALPVYKTNLLSSNIDFTQIDSELRTQYANIKQHVSLEKYGGVSTYSTEKSLHTNPVFKDLVDQILYHVKLYWKVLDVNDGLHPAIDECWSNRHIRNSFTDWHSHSMHPVVVSFYYKAPPGSGGIVFANPMEYGLTHIPYNASIEEKVNTTIHVNTGDMLIFPGWLRHKTETSYTDEERIVITFNIRYDGLYLDSQVPYPKIEEKPMPKNFSEPVTVYSDNSVMDYLFNKLHTQEVLIDQLKRTLTELSNGRK